MDNTLKLSDLPKIGDLIDVASISRNDLITIITDHTLRLMQSDSIVAQSVMLHGWQGLADRTTDSLQFMAATILNPQ